MTGTTPNGIRYPNDPNAYADLIKFFTEMATDVDAKFVPKNAVNSSVSGVFTAKTLVSSNGGLTQGSTVLQTGPTAASAFNIYDDNMKVDGSPGRRLWIAGANGTDVAIRTRASGENLNRISLRADTVDIQSNVTITGTLSIGGMKTVHAKYEANKTLAPNTSAWSLLYAATVGFTFVCPPSGAVIIGMGGSIPADGSSTYLSYEIRTGSTIGGGTVVFPFKPAGWDDIQPTPQGIGANGTGSGSTQWHTSYNAYLCGSAQGLVAGQTYHIRTYYRNHNPATLTMYRHYYIVQPDL